MQSFWINIINIFMQYIKESKLYFTSFLQKTMKYYYICLFQNDNEMLLLVLWILLFFIICLHLFFALNFEEMSHLTLLTISHAEKKINDITSWANAQNVIYFTKNVIFQLLTFIVTTIIFFSAWDKSRVLKWDNSTNSTQKLSFYWTWNLYWNAFM